MISLSSSDESLAGEVKEVLNYREEIGALAAEVQSLRDEVENTRKDLRAAQRENAKLQLMLDTKVSEVNGARQEYQENLTRGQ